MSGPAERRGRAPAAGREVAELLQGARVGTVTGFQAGTVRVSCPAAGVPATPARVVEGLSDDALARAARERAEALLVFEEGDPGRPVLLGILRSRAPLADALLTAPLPDAGRVARLDGRRVVLEGRDEVVLTCGKASLTLRRDGRVVLRGVDVVTRAERVQKIRGGKVQIN